MKLQVAWNWKASRTELVVRAQKGETLDLDDVAWLRAGLCPQLSFPEVEGGCWGRGKALVRYDILGCTSLSRRVKTPLGESALCSLLESLGRAVHACGCAGRPLERILYDPRHVYVDSNDRLRLIYVPFSGTCFDVRTNSPFALLEALANPRHLKLSSMAAHAHVEQLGRFIATEPTFSANRYQRFLARECPGARVPSIAETAEGRWPHEAALRAQ